MFFCFEVIALVVIWVYLMVLLNFFNENHPTNGILIHEFVKKKDTHEFVFLILFLFKYTIEHKSPTYVRKQVSGQLVSLLC